MPEQFRTQHEFAKAVEEDEYTYTYGPVLVPEQVDHQGDIISSAEIEKAAHDFMQDSQKPGLQHKVMLGTRDAVVVESHVLRQPFKVGKSTLPVGTWMLGMRVYDERLRKMIKRGELKGYSIGGAGESEEG